MTDREKPIYLDYNATTPVDERVLEKMLPYFTEHFGNAASKSHAYGWVAEEAVEQAREQVAALLHAEPSEVYFTSGATEALNLALKGLWQRYGSRKGHFITVATEHKAVLDVCQRLEAWGARLTYLPVDSNGGIDLRELERNITGKTLAVVAMYANNETGVIHPIGEIGALAVEHRVFFVTDATQAVGKVPVNVQRDGVHLLALNGHKLYGPKGIGAIYLRRRGPRVQLNPEMDGGGHERGILDGADGILARAKNMQSEFGRALDGTALWAKGICPDCTLTLGNIGATGDDGVRLDIQPSVSAKVETSAIELQEARVVSYQLGVLEQDAIGLIVLASLEMDGSQEKLIEVTPDLAAIASPGAEVTATISSDGELVQAVSGPVENPPRLFVKGMAEHGVSCAFLPKVQISLTASTEGLVWIILDVQGNVLGEGDEIAYTVSEQAAEPNVVVGATMHVANGSGVTIFDELATPPATCFADCDGSGGLDILDFVCYQGLFTSGDPAADCDGNGVLNILDFVCFQGAFQTGCP